MAFKLRFMCAAACLAAASAQAVPVTMASDQRVNGHWLLDGEWAVLQFSSLLITALNTAKGSLSAVSPADLQTSTTATSSTGVVTTRFTGVSASAPITALSFKPIETPSKSKERT